MTIWLERLPQNLLDDEPDVLVPGEVDSGLDMFHSGGVDHVFREATPGTVPACIHGGQTRVALRPLCQRDKRIVDPKVGAAGLLQKPTTSGSIVPIALVACNTRRIRPKKSSTEGGIEL